MTLWMNGKLVAFSVGYSFTGGIYIPRLAIEFPNRIALPGWFLLLAGIATGVAIYVAGSLLTKHECFVNLKVYIFSKRK